MSVPIGAMALLHGKVSACCTSIGPDVPRLGIKPRCILPLNIIAVKQSLAYTQFSQSAYCTKKKLASDLIIFAT